MRQCFDLAISEEFLQHICKPLATQGNEVSGHVAGVIHVAKWRYEVHASTQWLGYLGDRHVPGDVPGSEALRQESQA